MVGKIVVCRGWVGAIKRGSARSTPSGRLFRFKPDGSVHRMLSCPHCGAAFRDRTGYETDAGRHHRLAIKLVQKGADG